MCMCRQAHDAAVSQGQKSQDSLQGFILSFYHMGARNGTQVPRLGGKPFYPLSHHAST